MELTYGQVGLAYLDCQKVQQRIKRHWYWDVYFLIFSKVYAHRSYVYTSRPTHPSLVYNVAPRNAVTAKRPPVWYHSPRRIPNIAQSRCASFPFPFYLFQLLQLPVDLLVLLQKQEREHGVRANANEARHPALEHPAEPFCSHGVCDCLH